MDLKNDPFDRATMIRKKKNSEASNNQMGIEDA